MKRLSYSKGAAKVLGAIRTLFVAVVLVSPVAGHARAAECGAGGYDYDFTILVIPDGARMTPAQAIPPDIGAMLNPVQGGNARRPGVPAIPRIGIVGKPVSDGSGAGPVSISQDWSSQIIWPDWSSQMKNQACGPLAILSNYKPAPMDVVDNLRERLGGNEFKTPQSLSFERDLLDRKGNLAQLLSVLQQQTSRDSVLTLFVDVRADRQSGQFVELGGEQYPILMDGGKVVGQIRNFLTKNGNVTIKPTVILVFTETTPRPECTASIAHNQSVESGDHKSIPLGIKPANARCRSNLASGAPQWARLRNDQMLLEPPAGLLGTFELQLLIEGGKTQTVRLPLTVTVTPSAIPPSNVILRFSGSNTLGAKLIPLLAKGYIEHEFAGRHLRRVTIIDGPKDAQGEIVSREVKGRIG
jgi:hypothetical protein